MADRQFMSHLLLLSATVACRVLNYDCNEFVSERDRAERLWITLLLASWDLIYFCVRKCVCVECWDIMSKYQELYVWSRCECIEIGMCADFNEELNLTIYLLLKIVSRICVKINIGNCADYTQWKINQLTAFDEYIR